VEYKLHDPVQGIIMWSISRTKEVTGYFITEESRSLVTVLIKTRVDDRHNRDLLRRTWISDLREKSLKHVFLVGECPYPMEVGEDNSMVHSYQNGGIMPVLTDQAFCLGGASHKPRTG